MVPEIQQRGPAFGRFARSDRAIAAYRQTL